MLKSADEVDLEGRCRTHSLAQACVLFSQGIAFLHAGDELLRSKSLDRDGYNSGVQMSSDLRHFRIFGAVVSQAWPSY